MVAENDRRIPVIVFERPPLDVRRVLAYTLVGGGVGFVVGLALKWVGSWGGSDGVVGAGAHGTIWGYMPALLACGLLAGAGLGWSWDRRVIPRIERVPPPPSMRSKRRATSSALAPPT